VKKWTALKIEWNGKAGAFVSYGSATGAHAVQQPHETVIELQTSVKTQGRVALVSRDQHRTMSTMRESMVPLNRLN
jgi:hypothetical protein